MLLPAGHLLSSTAAARDVPSASVPRVLNLGSQNPRSPWVEFIRSADSDGKKLDHYVH